MKSFNSIAYTDIDRLFGSKPLREFFAIDECALDYPQKAEYVIGMLIKYKEKRGFRSFSRQFNTSGSTSNDAPIIAFCKWVEEQEKSQKNFYFRSCPVELFVDEPFSFDMLQLHINDSQKCEIAFAPEDISVEYLSPNGMEADAIINTEIGEWHVDINYKGEKHTETVFIKQLLSPRVDFDTKKLFGQGNTIDLRKLVIRATDGHGQNRKEELSISAVGDADIVQDVFTANNPCLLYTSQSPPLAPPPPRAA